VKKHKHSWGRMFKARQIRVLCGRFGGRDGRGKIWGIPRRVDHGGGWGGGVDSEGALRAVSFINCKYKKNAWRGDHQRLDSIRSYLEVEETRGSRGGLLLWEWGLLKTIGFGKRSKRMCKCKPASKKNISTGNVERNAKPDLGPYLDLGPQERKKHHNSEVIRIGRSLKWMAGH